ncbi:MAG TPA: hypothetical protein DEP87_03920 [Candidatus Pacebacteria bacterium]|nr:hypothetical protein [Candidatus Paceibacterota bacterium]
MSILSQLFWRIAHLFGLLKNQKLTNDQRIIQLMEAFQADEYGHEANLQTADLGYGFIHYGLIRQIKPKTVLCIGSRFGYIPAVLAQACYDNGFGQVYFVDAGLGETDAAAYTGKAYWRTPQGMAIFEKFGLGKFITLFVTTTKKFATLYPNLAFDYIYVDGDHSYKGATFDYKTFWPRLSQGGLMVFHDISIKEPMPEGEYGVYQVFAAARKKAGALVFPFLGSGLGILQKTKK